MKVIKKIKITSNNFCLGCEPKIGDEIEQRLTLNSKGQVFFSAKNYNATRYTIGRRIKKRVDPVATQKLLEDMYEYCDNNIMMYQVLDAGRYNIEIVFEDGTSFYRSGPMLFESEEFSALRESFINLLGIEDLLLFSDSPNDD